MILIITHRNDYTADFLINRLNSQNISYQRLNCEDLLDKPFKLTFGENSIIELLGQTEFKSVWFRRTKLPDFAGLQMHERQYLMNETEALLKGLFSIIAAKWLSDPFAVYQAEYKLLQLKQAKALGFTIPDSLITNSKIELQRFYHKYNSEVIVKPLNMTRIMTPDSVEFIYTNKLTDSILSNIEEFDLTPCIFQQRIEKKIELRITVVGNQVFAASVDSQASEETQLDWRRGENVFAKAELPELIVEKCLALVKQLGLNFGAIDMIQTPDDEYYFLEINPNGQWAWIETETGLPICQAIIDELCS